MERKLPYHTYEKKTFGNGTVSMQCRIIRLATGTDFATPPKIFGKQTAPAPNSPGTLLMPGSVDLARKEKNPIEPLNGGGGWIWLVGRHHAARESTTTRMERNREGEESRLAWQREPTVARFVGTKEIRIHPNEEGKGFTHLRGKEWARMDPSLRLAARKKNQRGWKIRCRRGEGGCGGDGCESGVATLRELKAQGKEIIQERSSLSWERHLVETNHKATPCPQFFSCPTGTALWCSVNFSRWHFILHPIQK